MQEQANFHFTNSMLKENGNIELTFCGSGNNRGHVLKIDICPTDSDTLKRNLEFHCLEALKKGAIK